MSRIRCLGGFDGPPARFQRMCSATYAVLPSAIVRSCAATVCIFKAGLTPNMPSCTGFHEDGFDKGNAPEATYEPDRTSIEIGRQAGTRRNF